MEQIIIIIHVIVAIMIVGLVLVQHGKGADAGASFGSGSSNTMFGSQGAMPFMMKVTALLAAIFFATNLTLSYIVGHKHVAQRAANTSSVPAAMGSASESVKNGSNKKQKPQFVFPSMKETSQGRDNKK